MNVVHVSQVACFCVFEDLSVECWLFFGTGWFTLSESVTDWSSAEEDVVLECASDVFWRFVCWVVSVNVSYKRDLFSETEDCASVEDDDLYK